MDKVLINKVMHILHYFQVMWNASTHAEYLHDHEDYGFEGAKAHFSWQ